jgi:predicted O-linked N-acetylglucosamine transferase (SPINDLY family)
MASISQALAIAIEHHRAGRLETAAHHYRQILAVEPKHAHALHLLGVVARQRGNHELAVEYIGQAIALDGNVAPFHNNLGNALKDLRKLDEAIGCYRRALELKPDDPEAHNNLGVALKDQGKLDEAVACYRRALVLQPGYAEVHGNLGVALKDQGKLDEAVACYRRALELKPDFAAAHSNLGNALQDLGRPEEAIACHRRALQLKPEYAEAHNNLGNALKDQGHLDEAIACYRRALQLNPNFAEAHSNLGIAFKEQRKLDDAILCYRRALQLKPDFAEAHSHLGNALNGQGKLSEAIACHRRALEWKPGYAEAHNNLGNALKDQGHLDEAVACYRRALELKPNDAQLHNNLGAVLCGQDKLDEAVACYRRALELKPDFAKAQNNLGAALKDQGMLDEAIACWRRALELKPDYAEAHSNLAYAQMFCPGCDARTLYEECRRWNHRHAAPLARLVQPHGNERSPERRLRVGYVSPDFRDHCQSFFTAPLFSRHDREKFEIVCYADVVRCDGGTERLCRDADAWRSITGLDDERVAQSIRDDRIDVLVDLTMHMARNRLLVFARKPAPVQVSWLAYPGTTGLSSIDYRITDRYLDPPGLDGPYYAEESVRLPDSFWCYDPLSGEPAVNSLPAAEKGYVAFGCLNNFCKVNPPVLKIWAAVLKAVDRSRLTILSAEGTHRRHTLDLLAAEGVAPDRVTFVARQPRRQYLTYYHGIDIALDTIPYNGHTTSLDSLWMGVPVVTLVGTTVVGRAGVCQLMNLGLPDLIASTPEQYVQVAATLAHDLPRLRQLRATLRQRMQASPLMDGPRFARNIEAAYREMWRRWCLHVGPPADGETAGKSMNE